MVDTGYIISTQVHLNVHQTDAALAWSNSEATESRWYPCYWRFLLVFSCILLQLWGVTFLILLVEDTPADASRINRQLSFPAPFLDSKLHNAGAMAAIFFIFFQSYVMLLPLIQLVILCFENLLVLLSFLCRLDVFTGTLPGRSCIIFGVPFGMVRQGCATKVIASQQQSNS